MLKPNPISGTPEAKLYTEHGAKRDATGFDHQERSEDTVETLTLLHLFCIVAKIRLTSSHNGPKVTE